MDKEYLDKLKERLDKGEISQETYDEISGRWSRDGKKGEQQGSENGDRNGTGRVVSVAGSGHFSDVDASELRISGSGHISGSVHVDKMSISGSGHVEGTIEVGEIMEVSGSLHANNAVKAASVSSSGSFRCLKINAEEIESSGSVRVQEEMKAGRIKTSGSCRAEKIECDELRSSGSIRAPSISAKLASIEGLIVAGKVTADDFRLYIRRSDSVIEQLEANTVLIESARRKFRSGSASIREIKCGTAKIEACTVERITGTEVEIGDYCKVGYVEAKIIRVSDRADVRERKVL